MLTYSDEVIHLGHVLSFDLNDGPDILRVLKDLNRKANCVLCTFHFADCYIKCFLIIIVSIVLSVSGVSPLYRIIYNRFMKFYKSGLESKSTFVSQIFNESSSFVYTFIGYNLWLGHTYIKNENISDRFMQISRLIRSIRHVFGVVSPFEDLLVNLSCS